MTDMAANCLSCVLKTAEEEYKKQVVKAQNHEGVNWHFASHAVQCLKPNCAGASRTESIEVVASSNEVRCEAHRNSSTTFWEIYKFLMSAFDTLDLRDISIAGDLLRYAYYFSKKFETAAHCFGNSSRFFCFERTCYHSALSEREFQQLLTINYNCDYDKLWNGDYCVHQVVWGAITAGYERVLPGLLKYGVVFIHPTYNCQLEAVRYAYAVKSLIMDRRKIQREPPTGIFGFAWGWGSSDEERRKTMGVRCIVRRVVEILSWELMWVLLPRDSDEPHPSKRRRVGEYGSSSSSVYFRCLRRAFDTIPDPYVTSNELREVFRFEFGNDLDEEKDLYIEELISEFEDIYPEGAGGLKPRSLKHLSRCRVRENLRIAGSLPHGARDLRLPGRLENYILLEQLAAPLMTKPQAELNKSVGQDLQQFSPNQ